MTFSFGSQNPLQYEGVQAPNPPNVIQAQRAPTVNDTYTIGTIWIDQVGLAVYEIIAVVNSQANWTILGGAGAAVAALTPDIGGPIAPVAGNINIDGGTGIQTTGAGNTITINAVGGGITFTTVVANTPMAINNGYITNKAGTAAVMTLPAVAAVGSRIDVIGRGVTGWTIAQNAGQQINLGAVSTTVGVGGSLASTQRYDAVVLICTVANTEFTVESGTGIYTVT